MERPLRMITTGSVRLSLYLVVSIGVAGASGQNTVTRKRQEPGSSSSASDTLRTRRVEADSARESTRAAGKSTSGTAAPDNGGSVKPAVPSPRAEEAPGKPANTATIETPSEPNGTQDSHTSSVSASLRDQIEAAPDGPERLRLRLRLAEELSQSGENEEANAELHAISKSNVFDPPAFYNAGNALARLGDSDGAINAYRKAIDQRKGNYSRALNNLGVILLRQGRWDEAHDALLSALKLESFHYAEASFNLGRLYYARGESDMAAREWRRVLRIDPEHQAAAQALSLIGSGAIVVRPESSAKAPEPPSRVPGPSARVNETSPRLGISSSSPNPAPAKALTLDPISYEFLQRARSLSELGKHREAIESYQRVLSRSHGYFPPANLELSYALLALNRTDEAFANLLQVANRDGARYPMTYYYLARLYELKGNLTEAEESFANAAIAYKTKNISFLLDLSRVRERRGNFQGALEALEEYVAGMEQKGLKPSWADQSLSALRLKATSEPK